MPERTMVCGESMLEPRKRVRRKKQLKYPCILTISSHPTSAALGGGGGGGRVGGEGVKLSLRKGWGEQEERCFNVCLCVSYYLNVF